MRKLTVLKIGGSVLTDKRSQTPKINLENMARISREIAVVYKKDKNPLVIVHGTGSYGHWIVKRTRIFEGIRTEKQLKDLAETQVLQNELNCIFTRHLIDEGIPAIPCQASAIVVMDSGRIRLMNVSAIKGFLDIGMIPVLYGVPAYDLVQKCSGLSSDQIASYLAVRLKAKRIIHGTNVDGVFSSNPENPDAKLISEINHQNIDSIKESLIRCSSVDASGSMLGKVNELSVRVESQIVNALTPGNIIRALRGEEIGTRIKLC